MFSSITSYLFYRFCRRYESTNYDYDYYRQESFQYNRSRGEPRVDRQSSVPYRSAAYEYCARGGERPRVATNGDDAMDRRRSFAERPPGDRPRRDGSFQQRKPFSRYRVNGPPHPPSAPTGSSTPVQPPPPTAAFAPASASTDAVQTPEGASFSPGGAPGGSSAPSSERTRARGRGRGGRGRGRGRGRGGKDSEPSCIVSRAVLKSDRDPEIIKAWCARSVVNSTQNLL